LLEKHVQIKTSLFNKILLGVTCFALGRSRRHIKAGMTLVKDVPQKVKFTESPLNLKSPLRVFAEHGIYDMISPLTFSRVAYAKFLRELVGRKRLIDR
jgi:hypothetical protein